MIDDAVKKYDVVTICNALYDEIFSAEDSDLQALGFEKGNMYLIDQKTRQSLADHFKGREKGGELGGSALNAIRALALLGKNVCFGGAVADDEHGQKIRGRMDALRIAHFLRTTEAESTGTCMVLVTEDGERTMATYLGASRLYEEDILPPEVLQNAGWFHFCGYQWDTEGQKATIRSAVDKARAGGARISLDLADPLVVTHHRDDLIAMMQQKAHLVFANKAEAKLLFDESPELTAERLAAWGLTVVIKLGAEGALIAKGEERVRIRPVPTTVLDTTAAGDMFAAGFLHGLCAGRTLDECGRTAARLASDVISRYGAVLSDSVIAELSSGV